MLHARTVEYHCILVTLPAGYKHETLSNGLAANSKHHTHKHSATKYIDPSICLLIAYIGGIT
jgi:hypothetical protein